MRFAHFQNMSGEGLAVQCADGSWRGAMRGDAAFSGSIGKLLATGGNALAEAHGKLRAGFEIDLEAVTFQPPLRYPPKIICVGLNYADHTAESQMKQPDYPTVFGRFNSSLVGHRQPIIRPSASEQLDYEGELVAVIGRGGHAITKKGALDHVAGWSIFNDASIRDYQLKGAQWTMGKNFDGTGAFGPIFVTADEIPMGGAGLKLETRLNGQIVQQASTAEMIFDVATLITVISSVMSLEAGDIIATGTPSGVGHARNPPLWMKHGDMVEVDIEGLGTLQNVVQAESQ
jgi:acylpyruvate hydrolase